MMKGRPQVALLAGVLMLSAAAGARAETQVLVGPEASLIYQVNTTDPGFGTAWTEPDFDDSAWLEGTNGIGIEVDATLRTVPPGTMEEVHPGTLLVPRTPLQAGTRSVYARYKFTIDDPAAVSSVMLSGEFAGAMIVWINGQEVYRAPGLPAGAPQWNTRSSGALWRARNFGFHYNVTDRARNALRQGENLMAVGGWTDFDSGDDIFIGPEVLAATTAALPRGPYLQQTTSTSVIVRWRTDTASDSRVVYGASASSLTKTASDSASTTEHVVKVTGLSPDTKYYYGVGTSSTILAGGDSNHFFVTAPVIGTKRPTRIWAIGDSGTGSSAQLSVRDAYYNYTGSKPTDLWLMLGDNAYDNGTDSEYQDVVFNVYADLLRKSPLWPTIGNHDAHSASSSSQSGPYYANFTLPKQGEAGGLGSGTEAYYSYDYANIHFVVLDSQGSSRSTSGAMLTWLEKDLQATSQEWIIAYWHHPPYSKGSHDSDSETELKEMRQNALPILENYGVDLVLGGHSHSYERSYLLNGHYGSSGTLTSAMKVDSGSGQVENDGAYAKGSSPDGAVYAVAGSSGQTSGGSLNHPANFTSQNKLASMVIDIDGDTLKATALGSSGSAIDHFTITKSITPPPTDPPPAPQNVKLK